LKNIPQDSPIKVVPAIDPKDLERLKTDVRKSFTYFKNDEDKQEWECFFKEMDVLGIYVLYYIN